MIFETGFWQIQGSPFSWVFAFVIILIALIISFQTWLRMKKKRRIALLESFRVLIVMLVVFTLLDPGMVEKIDNTKKSQIICLQDVSESMQTKDVMVEDGEPIERSAWSKKFLQNQWVQNLETNASFLVKKFSSPAGPKATNITQAIQQVLNQNDSVKAILVLTDGDTNNGSSVLSVAGKSRALSVPVYSVITGSDASLPDLSLDEVFAPSYVLQGERVMISWQATNHFKTSQKTSLSLFSNGEKILEKPVDFQGGESISGNLSWLPEKEGQIDFEIILGEVKKETYKKNNQKKIRTRVESKTIRVLIVDSLPRWEYRYLRNALSRDPGVNLSCVLLHPGMDSPSGATYIPEFPTDEASLSPYDVIFLGDVGLDEAELSEDQCDLLANLIQYQAAGLIFMPGRRGRQQSLTKTSLGEILPVVYDFEKPRGLGTQNPASYILTQKGRDHWLTKLRGTGEKSRDFWSKLPGFHWSATVSKSRPGSEVLAVHSNYVTEWGKMPILVIRQTGAGKSLYLGSDSAWRWRRGVEDKYHYRFWSQVVRWMAHGRYLAEKEGIKLIPSPENPRLGEKVFLRCIVHDQYGFPLEKGQVKGVARHANGEVENVTFRKDPDCSGVFLASIQAAAAGELCFEAVCEPVDNFIKTKLYVEESNREKQGNPANPVALQQLANLTGGVSKNYRDAKDVISALSIESKTTPMLKINNLRTNLYWGSFLFFLLAIYWTGRKFFGMV